MLKRWADGWNWDFYGEPNWWWIVISWVGGMSNIANLFHFSQLCELTGVRNCTVRLAFGRLRSLRG